MKIIGLVMIFFFAIGKSVSSQNKSILSKYLSFSKVDSIDGDFLKQYFASKLQGQIIITSISDSLFNNVTFSLQNQEIIEEGMDVTVNEIKKQMDIVDYKKNLLTRVDNYTDSSQITFFQLSDIQVHKTGKSQKINNWKCNEWKCNDDDMQEFSFWICDDLPWNINPGIYNKNFTGGLVFFEEKVFKQRRLILKSFELSDEIQVQTSPYQNKPIKKKRFIFD